jgi:hypothetical protein
MFTKFSALTKYIFGKLNFSTNNIFLVKIAKITLACHWVSYYSGYKVLEIPQDMYKVWILVQKARCWLKDVFSYSLLHFHVNQLTTAWFSTRVSTMRCFHAPEEKIELVGCYVEECWIWRAGFWFSVLWQSEFSGIFGAQMYTKTPKISHFLLWNFCGKTSLLWWAYRKVGWLTITMTT